nr:protein executer 1, chloroplastic [Quercus suber]
MELNLPLHKVVFLKWRGIFQNSPAISSKALDATGNLNLLDSIEDTSDLFVVNTEDGDDRDDSSDLVKVKVLKVTALGKVDRELISKLIKQIIEEEDEEKDKEIESVEVKDEVHGGK